MLPLKSLVKNISWLLLSILILCYSVTCIAAIGKMNGKMTISAEEAKMAIQQDYKGAVVLRLWRKNYKGKEAYYVRTLSPSGKVHTHIVDAVSADIVK